MAALPRIYSILFTAVTVAAVQDLFSVKASATNGVAFRRASLSAAGVTAPAEIQIRLKRLPATVTVGSGGSAPTVQKASSRLNITTLSTFARANDTAQATTSGTAVILASWNWNVLQDFLEVPPTPEERWEADISEALILEVSATPASTVLSGTFVFEET